MATNQLAVGALVAALALTFGLRDATGSGSHSGSHSSSHSSNHHSSSSSSHSGSLHSSSSSGHSGGHPKATGVTRHSHGKIKRSEKAKEDFKKQHPCPATGKTHGSCPGYVIDH